MNEEVKNAKEPKDGIALVKKYQHLLKGGNKVGKQGGVVKKMMNSLTALV